MKKRIDPKVEKLLSNAEWREERKSLRAIILDCQLDEAVKWGKLCYTFQKSNVVMIYGLKEYCAVGFLKGALLKDTKGILVKPGSNSQAMRWMKFNDPGDVAEMETILRAYITEAIEVEKAGLKVDFKEKNELVFPKELLHAFEANPALKKAFDALTPGRQRGYNLYFSGAKQSKTRVSRIKKYMQKILDVKGLNDR